MPITVRKFLQGPGKVLAIEQTIDTEGSGKYRLIINNKDHAHSIKKIGELLVQLMKAKDTLPTMISSLARFLSYPEMNGGPPITASLSDQVAALELQVASQFVPQMTTTHSHPVKTSIWDPPLNITTTTVQVPATTTPMTYKSAVQNQLATTTQSKSNQIQPAATTPSPQQRQQQRQQQQPDQDSDKMETGSTKSEISEISATPTIQTLVMAVSAMTTTLTEAVTEMRN